MTTNRPPFALSTIGQVAIPVIDLDRAVAFYRDRLGLRFLFQAPPGLAFFDCAGLRLMLDLPIGKSGPSTSIIYFKVENITDAYEELEKRGVSFDDVPHLIHKSEDQELWMCFFHDTEGNSLALMCEVTL